MRDYQISGNFLCVLLTSPIELVWLSSRRQSLLREALAEHKASLDKEENNYLANGNAHNVCCKFRPFFPRIKERIRFEDRSDEKLRSLGGIDHVL